MKTSKKLLIFTLCFILVERFCRLQTDGFSIAKIAPHASLTSQEITTGPEILKALDQPYTFLGSGVQCYAFLSQDQKTVIKFFKHYHLFPGNNLLEKIPVPSFLDFFKQRWIKSREERLRKILKSCQIAHEQLQEQTGLFFLHLNRSPCAKICLIDKLGIQHLLDLTDIEFILQKRAEPLEARYKRLLLAKDMRGAETVLETLKHFHLDCTERGFKNKDGKIRNFAFIGERPVMIDIGSIKKRKDLSPGIIAHAQTKFENKVDLWREWFENSL